MEVVNSRSKHLKKNIMVGFIAQLMVLFFAFIGRKLFIEFLSIEYLGINGLYTNIFSMVSLAELGLSSVVSFSLYKPVAENNQPMIRALVAYYKKLYLMIAAVILAVGLSLIPFLKYLVKSDLSESDLIIYYILFLINTIATYFVAHKIALLGAYQESRIQKYIDLFTAILLQILHILVLLIYPNYIVYVIVTIICTFINKVIVSSITNKKYKYLSHKDDAQIIINKKLIKKNVKATGLYKLSTVLINSTDNILISALVSTFAVGLYSNYSIITGALQTFISIVTASLINGVGNLFTENKRQRMLDIFQMLTGAYHFVSAYCAITLYNVFNDFVTFWLGKPYLLDNSVIFAIAFNFYLTNLTTPVWSFREATGQFIKAKHIMLICAFVNIVLSLVLGIYFGVFGILIATAISKLLTMFWYEPRILFRHVFKASQMIYWLQQIRYVFCSFVCAVICNFISNAMGDSLLFIILKATVFFAVCIIMFIVLNFKSHESNLIKIELQRRGYINVRL